MSGMPCGKKAALATKGYFANARNRRGRQLGRVLASRYGEIVTDQVFAGTTALATAPAGDEKALAMAGIGMFISWSVRAVAPASPMLPRMSTELLTPALW